MKTIRMSTRCGKMRPYGQPYYCTLARGHNGNHVSKEYTSSGAMKATAVWGSEDSPPELQIRTRITSGPKLRGAVNNKQTNNMPKTPPAKAKRPPRQKVSHYDFGKILLSVNADRDKIIELIQKGSMVKDIAATYKVPESTMKNILETASIEVPRLRASPIGDNVRAKVDALMIVVARIANMKAVPAPELAAFTSNGQVG